MNNSIWQNLKITNEQVGNAVGNSIVIYLPKSSKYAGYYFFHPAKLVRRQGYAFSFGFTDDFKFNLKKNGNGRYNKFDVIKEVTLSATELKEAFEKQQKGIWD
ncbi:hypothetical protein HLA87_02405 [Mycoplasma miroungigenitalium]|uniref:Uncharacterized protein n=1 Tax=Mycoplasma miroungigenitalium TaxID=754515 RepID=A0A6M4JC79_9MOLU|nr:hypothetical protein [Mycoplasma miroungigenitalium]QJR43626.1 hypothetical protein HLA87_02405 [Mycoplasma miroungigenitalium]